MKKQIVPLAMCFLLLLLVFNGAHHVEGRRHRRQQPRYNLLVFGDSFVDAGNLPKAERSVLSRSWYYPYGISTNNRATGRFSDGMLQSDFVARILGLDECPPAYRTLGPNDDVDPSGVNFAVGGTGVLVGTPSLRQQVDQLAGLVKDGAIRDRDLEYSVALISNSAGRDYSDIRGPNSNDEMMSRSRNVTDEMKVVVKRLLEDVGVSKVMVNTLPPMGCTPFESAHNNYGHCESRGNMMSDVHNTALRRKLDEFDSDEVLLLDLNSAFSGLVQDGAAAGQFTSRLTECCVARRGGYCGEVDAWGRQLYNLCPDPDHHFFWDYVHPTQAAWNAVMTKLQDPIKDFLASSNDDDRH